MKILTAGESHGPVLTAIIEGFPANFTIDIDHINDALAKRQEGYGRGRRMQIEEDKVTILSGVRDNVTLGSPITLQVKNKDYDNWQEIMNSEENNAIKSQKRKVVTPRPGHADLVGGQKRQFKDLRNVLERSSARETAIRVAIGALCEQLLNKLGVKLYGYVTQVGEITAPKLNDDMSKYYQIDSSLVRMLDHDKALEAVKVIDEAQKKRTTIGGAFCIEIHHLPAGIGDYTHWQHKLDAILAYQLMSINAVKNISFGDFDNSSFRYGYELMDEITYTDEDGYSRKTNHLGGIEGGMSNGMPIIINGVMKPIPTQMRPLETINIEDKSKALASVERSDTCAIDACAITAMYVSATALTEVILTQFDAVDFKRLSKQWQEYKIEVQNY